MSAAGWPRRAELLGKGHALGGVVGGGEHVVGELAEVVEQPLALVPEEPRVDDDLLGVLVGLAAQQLGLPLGALNAALGLRARAGGDLVGRLVRALQDAGRLLTNLVESALNDASRVWRLSRSATRSATWSTKSSTACRS